MDQGNTLGRKPSARKPSPAGSGGSAPGAASAPDEARVSQLAVETTPDNLKDVNFEQAIAELESLVAKLEGGDLALEDALAAYQRGSLVMRHAQGLLEHVQAQIDVIESGQVRSIDRASLISQIKE